MNVNEYLDKYIQQAEKLEIKLKQMNLKENKSHPDYQRLGIIQGQLMVIDTVIDDLMSRDTASNNSKFSMLLISLKKRKFKNVY